MTTRMTICTGGLAPLAPDLWTAHHDVVMGGVMHFEATMTVVRLSDGTLWLHSPIPIDDSLAAELGELGDVAHIVAPNRLHHLFVAQATQRYPKARVWAAPGLASKRTDLRFDEELGNAPPPAWQGDLDQIHVAGNRWASEVVFFHRASATLLVTDLLFNIHHAPNWITRFVLRLVGAWAKVSQSRAWRFTTKDRPTARQRVHAILEWDFDRIAMAHGRPIEAHAKAVLARELAWLDPSLPQQAALPSRAG